MVFAGTKTEGGVQSATAQTNTCQVIFLFVPVKGLDPSRTKREGACKASCQPTWRGQGASLLLQLLFSPRGPTDNQINDLHKGRHKISQTDLDWPTGLRWFFPCIDPPILFFLVIILFFIIMIIIIIIIIFIILLPWLSYYFSWLSHSNVLPI